MAANLFLDLCLKLAGIFIWTIDISSDPLLDLAGNLSTCSHLAAAKGDRRLNIFKIEGILD